MIKIISTFFITKLYLNWISIESFCSEKDELKLEDIAEQSNLKTESNEFETCPSSLAEARKRNQKIIEV